jgi:hypothetical protein
MTTSDSGSDAFPPLVRSYVITDGRVADSELFDLVTLVKANPIDENQRGKPLDPEKRRLLELSSRGYLSVAEIAAHLRLPLGIIRVLLADLLAEGRLTRSSAPRPSGVSRKILQEVLDGLRARFNVA